MKVSVGGLSKTKPSVAPRPHSQSAGLAKPQSSFDSSNLAYNASEETPLPGTQVDLLRPNIPEVDKSVATQLSESPYHGYLDAIDQLPMSSTWDFDFSLDPFLTCATDFPESPEWALPNGQLYAEAGIPGENGTARSGATPTSSDPAEVDGAVMEDLTNAAEYVDRDAVRRKRPRVKSTRTPSADHMFLNGDSDKDDSFFFQHYEQCIGGWAYSLKDDGKGNYLRFVLDFIRSPRCCPASPFRLAVLAWAAKHWALTCKPDSTAWKEYYSQASAEIQRLQYNSDWVSSPPVNSSEMDVLSSPAEIIICSTLFLCRCAVLNDDLDCILRHLGDLKLGLHQILSGPKLSAFGCQILLWLGYLHVRVSIFSSKKQADNIENRRVVATTLLDAISDHPDYQYICDRSHLYLSEIFGRSYPAEEMLQDVEKAPVSVRTHETFCLIANMLRYRSWKQNSETKVESAEYRELEKAKIATIDIDIRRMDVEFGLAIATNPSAAVLQQQHSPTGPRRHSFMAATSRINSMVTDAPNAQSPESVSPTGNSSHACSPGSTGMTVAQGVDIRSSAHNSRPMKRASLQWLSCYAVFLTAKILWSRILHPNVRSEDTAKAAAREIMQIALHLRKAHQRPGTAPSWSRKIPRSMLWPLPLFMAGIETRDELHADWILGFMNEVTSSWGGEVVVTGQRWRRDEMSGAVPSSASRVQALMERVREAQDYLGCRADVESIMAGMMMERGSFLL
ncbi:hypothetical protein VFPPC_06302 [Pochonia chlamydosporia 170]|uniref:Fungal specific transcription factor domain-containing protein n=1 Tax=Pochonia chlamydosporia 170 TaxID=1380566 RepID=A0A179FHN0_METCM|nr:hypothetical protein VFPPC_06302 [Pochonia chlamydosporia 170]OAQ65135.1 hypothetical protein VFPPC_06302 [Pochonia chlamydosporia 170]